MAPSNRSSSKKKKKTKGGGVDFKKVKHKVGRKLLPAANVTKVEVKSKTILLPEQSVAQEKDGLAVNSRRQTLKELLMQTTHHNENVRREALMGIKDLITRHPKELTSHAITIIEKLSPRMTDNDEGVRKALLNLFSTSIFEGLPQAVVGPLLPVMMAYVFSAMTHLTLGVRLSAFSFLDLMIQFYPSLVVSRFMGQIIQQYVELLGKVGVLGQVGSHLPELLSSLVNFLSAVHMKISPQNSKETIGMVPQIKRNLKDTLTPQDKESAILALHWFKSDLPLETWSSNLSSVKDLTKEKETADLSITSKRFGRFSKVLAASLIQGLLNCWADCVPSVCCGQAPDGICLDCMVSITQALHIILQIVKSEYSRVVSSIEGYTQNIAKKEIFSDVHGEHMELHTWVRKYALSALSRHFMAPFPIYAPAVHLPKKLEEGIVALNVGIAVVILDAITLGGIQETDGFYFGSILQYVESALHGQMVPSSGISSSMIDKKLFERHLKFLIHFVPSLLFCIGTEWQDKLLEAFTGVFLSCKVKSSTKLVCISSISQMLQPEKLLDANTAQGSNVNVPLRFQKKWLQALPKLLWELNHEYSTSTMAVLKVLHQLGRSAPEDSHLAKEYTELQSLLIPFFCTIAPSRHRQERWLYGPFVRLPLQCQELAIDSLFYLQSFSNAFLRAIAHCCLCPAVELSVIVRCVEILQRAFCRGSIKLPEHMSFLLTLIVGRGCSQGVTKEDSLSHELEERRAKFRRQRAITGAVCSCLSQIGDGSILLHLSTPSICQQLALSLPLEVSYGLMKMVAVLGCTFKSLNLPESLAELLPQFVANHLVSAVMDDGLHTESRKEDSLFGPYVQPCFFLLSKSDKLTESVIRQLCSSLSEDCESLSTEDLKQVYATACALLQIFQQDHLRCRLASESGISTVLHCTNVVDFVQVRSFETKELNKLCKQLRSASCLLYESQRKAEDGVHNK